MRDRRVKRVFKKMRNTGIASKTLQNNRNWDGTGNPETWSKTTAKSNKMIQSWVKATMRNISFKNVMQHENKFDYIEFLDVWNI